MRKCPGVRAVRSEGSGDMAQRGLELRQASTWANTVWNSSKTNLISPTTLRRWNLADFTAASHKPPWWGAEGGLKHHWVPRSKWNSTNWDLNCSSINPSSLSAPTKLVPQSLYKWLGTPRLALNLLKQPMNDSEVKSPTASKCLT